LFKLSLLKQINARRFAGRFHYHCGRLAESRTFPISNVRANPLKCATDTPTVRAVAFPRLGGNFAGRNVVKAATAGLQGAAVRGDGRSQSERQAFNQDAAIDFRAFILLGRASEWAHALRREANTDTWRGSHR
jgi:hypothetical protein